MHRKYEIKSKKTQYGSVLFKSILEARWAVFFDSLGITYTYEPDCFEVETGGRTVTYKPDFFLPDLSKYIEIKPNKPYEIEKTKAAAWSKHIGDTIILFNLNPPSGNLENGWEFSFSEIQNIPMLSKCLCWGECPKCSHIDLAEDGELTSCGCFTLNDFNNMYEVEEEKGICITPNFKKSERLLTAYKKAKTFKFNSNNLSRVPMLHIQLGLFK
jgi:hypothetical protein